MGGKDITQPEPIKRSRGEPMGIRVFLTQVRSSFGGAIDYESTIRARDRGVAQYCTESKTQRHRKSETLVNSGNSGSYPEWRGLVTALSDSHPRTESPVTWVYEDLPCAGVRMNG